MSNILMTVAVGSSDAFAAFAVPAAVIGLALWFADRQERRT